MKRRRRCWSSIFSFNCCFYLHVSSKWFLRVYRFFSPFCICAVPSATSSLSAHPPSSSPLIFVQQKFEPLKWYVKHVLRRQNFQVSNNCQYQLALGCLLYTDRKVVKFFPIKNDEFVYKNRPSSSAKFPPSWTTHDPLSLLYLVLESGREEENIESLMNYGGQSMKGHLRFIDLWLLKAPLHLSHISSHEAVWVSEWEQP